MCNKTFGCVEFFVLKCSPFNESNVCYKFRKIACFFAVTVSLRNCFLVHGFQSSQWINFFHVTCARAGKFGGLSTATSFREIGKTCWLHDRPCSPDSLVDGFPVKAVPILSAELKRYARRWKIFFWSDRHYLRKQTANWDEVTFRGHTQCWRCGLHVASWEQALLLSRFDAQFEIDLNLCKMLRCIVCFVDVYKKWIAICSKSVYQIFLWLIL